MFIVICSGLCEFFVIKLIIEVRYDVFRGVIRKKLVLNIKIWFDESDFYFIYFFRGWSIVFVIKRGD